METNNIVMKCESISKNAIYYIKCKITMLHLHHFIPPGNHSHKQRLNTFAFLLFLNIFQWNFWWGLPTPTIQSGLVTPRRHRSATWRRTRPCLTHEKVCASCASAVASRLCSCALAWHSANWVMVHLWSAWSAFFFNLNWNKIIIQQLHRACS